MSSAYIIHYSIHYSRAGVVRRERFKRAPTHKSRKQLDMRARVSSASLAQPKTICHGARASSSQDTARKNSGWKATCTRHTDGGQGVTSNKPGIAWGASKSPQQPYHTAVAIKDTKKLLVSRVTTPAVRWSLRPQREPVNAKSNRWPAFHPLMGDAHTSTNI